MPVPTRNRLVGGWRRPGAAAAVVIVAAVLVFAVVPGWIVGGAVLAGSPLFRDLLVLVWTTVGFVVLAWLVVRFQREPGR